ncbi:MAG TPA: ABC transporter substrate-binding protein [Cyclobacteriaceae bacterium]|nr:ABC transporter substrate-binding protein [Cyclobacteriaceae bacterium]
MRRLALILFVLLGFITADAQDLKRQYKHARQLFDSKDYALAMEAFKPLIVYDKDNPSPEYSSFYYAIAAHQLGYKAVSKDMLLQVRNLYPNWDQMPEVNYWLAKIYFDQREYFQGMHVLHELHASQLTEDIALMKRHYLGEIKDIETLRMMSEEYPTDVEVARALVKALGQEAFKPSVRRTFDSLVTLFNFRREEFDINEGPISLKKDKYIVSLLFPFLANTLMPVPNSQRQNQSVLEMYQGMRMAVDTLEKKGIHIDLRSYDTERDPVALKKILEAPELKNSDMIVGPLFAEQIKAVSDFSLANQITMINPVSNAADYFKDNPYALLFQSSHATMGERAAEVLNSAIRNKNIIVYFGDAPKDSIMAFAFMRKAQEVGLKIVLAEEHRRETAAKILTTLATPTEFDDFKNPTQFTLKLDSIGGIYVASDNPLIYSKVTSSMTARRDSVVVIGSENWISPDNTSVNFENLERIHTLFAANNFTSQRNPWFIDFKKKFLAKHGEYPDFYAKLGYEFMYFVGHAMHDYGNYFQQALAEKGYYKAWMYEGYDFTTQHDNQYVPFVYFDHGELRLFNKK